jgi:type I restriction enzyme S subunit
MELVETRKYKKTELGMIPNDWEVKTLENFCSRIGDGIHSTPNYSDNGDYYFVNGNNLKDGKIVIFEGTKRVSKDEFLIHKRDLNKSTVLISINGTIGNIAFYNGENVVLGKSAAYINLTEKIDKRLLYQLVQTEFIKLYFEDELTGSTIKNLGLNAIRNTPIPLPPTLAEQTLIANALSDADTLISNLEQLIAKKKLIKQGAMQQLLKPKKGWEVKKLGEVLNIRKGQLITDKTRVDGDIPVIAGGKQPAYYHNKPNRFGKTITISGSGASAGYVSFHNYPIFASDCSTVEESKQYSIEYVFFLFQFLQEIIYKKQTGGAQPHIHPSDLNPIEVSFPDKIEQTRIAEILSDMVSEISALENKLGKYRKIKQGMMQNLLTGKIRLV